MEISASSQKEMEKTAAQMRELIAAMPPHDLLGYIYAQRLMRAMTDQRATDKMHEEDGRDDMINEIQFLLEYVHAVLATDDTPAGATFDEVRCEYLFEISRKLKEQAMLFAMATSTGGKSGAFGPDSAEIEFHAKSTWVGLRGNRYQVLEGEFYLLISSET